MIWVACRAKGQRKQRILRKRWAIGLDKGQKRSYELTEWACWTVGMSVMSQAKFLGSRGTTISLNKDCTLLAEKYSCCQKTLIGFTFCWRADHSVRLPAHCMYLLCSFSFEFGAKYGILRHRDLYHITGSRERRGGSPSLGRPISKEANHQQPLVQPTLPLPPKSTDRTLRPTSITAIKPPRTCPWIYSTPIPHRTCEEAPDSLGQGPYHTEPPRLCPHPQRPWQALPRPRSWRRSR